MRAGKLGPILSSGLLIPDAPSGVNITQDTDANSWDVSWTDNSSNETGFEVEYEVDNSGTWESWGSVGAGVTSLNNQVVGASYQSDLHNKQVSARVRAVNGGAGSAWIEDSTPPTASFNLPAAPGGFIGLAEDGLGIVTGSFTDNSSNETEFVVTARVNGGGYVARETLAANTTSITGHSPNIEYGAVNTDSYQIGVRASRYGRLSTLHTSNVIILANQPS